MSLVELRFSPRREHVRTARLVVVSLARRAGVPEVLLDEVRLAVGEACGLAVDTSAPASAPVVVEVEDGGPRGRDLVVSVSDVGAPDGDASVAPLAPGDDLADAVRPLGADDVEDGLPGGLELALLEGLVDDVRVRGRADGSGTEVVLKWPRTPPGRGRTGTV